MATTTNYGWTTPDDTALVKDGAAAIRTLGTSVDTTTKALNPSTTLGDIEYRSSTANTNTRLGIGTSGQILTVAAGVPSWATPTSGSMTLLSTTTLSGTSTTISSINQTYKDLLFIGYGLTYSANMNLLVQPNSGYANCRGVGVSYAGSSATAIDDTQINPYTGGNIASNSSNSFYLIFNNYTSTTRKPFQVYGGHATSNCTYSVAGVCTSGSAITAMQFTSSAGTASFTAGTVLTYGVN